MNQKKYLIIYIILFISNVCLSQISERSYWFISSAYGVQISGIKSEDFVSSNIAPSLVFNFGKWVSNEVALSFGYKGPYFHTISDNQKHYYSFIYGEVLVSINDLIKSNSDVNKWNLIIHPGAGYFYNNYYNRPNICGNIGINNSFFILNRIDVFVDVAAIFGWDIYQEDEDIIPSCVIGLTYVFR